MRTLSSKLRIGEKIGLSTGLVGLLFLLVIWHYHQSLQGVLRNYERLHEQFGAREIYAFEIARTLAATRLAEKSFLIGRDEAQAAGVDAQVTQLLEKTRHLAQVDQDSQVTAANIQTHIEIYQQRFHAIFEAWRVKGLDHDSGLQGTFRERVHELEDLAGNFNADRLYLQLLQIRRGEKDLGLRREVQYRTRVGDLIGGFRTLVRASELKSEVKERLLHEIEIYAETFAAYSAQVLDNQDIAGGKGPFRQAAHRIEDILNAHRVPELQTDILQMRRREKDYLLRGDQRYVNMVSEIAQGIRNRIATSRLSAQNQERLFELLDAYQQNFLALVKQNQVIDRLDVEMSEAASRITPLVKANLDQASELVDTMELRIAKSSAESERLNLLIVVCASTLGMVLATLITLRIVGSVRQMAGLLDRLTHENPSERIATVAGARDELNAMAESLNTMADHKASFVHWWQSSMREAIALRDLNMPSSEADHQEALSELRAAAISQVQQLNAIRGQLRKRARRILEVTERIASARRGTAAEKEVEDLKRAAHGISTLLEVTALEDEDSSPADPPSISPKAP